MAKILLQDPPRVREIAPQIPAAVDELLAQMLAKDSTLRLPNGGALLAALDALGEVGDVPAVGIRQRRRPSLTATEQRIACVVMTGPSGMGTERWQGSTVQI